MQKIKPPADPYRDRNDLTVAAPLMKEGLPTGGGLGGVKRLQLQQAAGQKYMPPRPGTGNTGIVPPKPAPTRVAQTGYEQPRPLNFNQRLSALSTPNFPRRRGQG